MTPACFIIEPSINYSSIEPGEFCGTLFELTRQAKALALHASITPIPIGCVIAGS
jgi:hypothetical protein